MNVVIYARFSSHSQTEQSIEGQLKVCYEYAEQNHYTIIGEYIDRAVSGKYDNRAEFQRMISDSEKHAFEGILVYQLDRFARNRYDSAIYKSKLKKNGVRVLSARENITDDASGILVEGVLESMAEYFPAELSQKIHRGMEINAQKCLSNGSNPGLGFKVDKDRHFYVDEEEAKIVREIFERYASGETKAEIVKNLKRRKIKTSLGNDFTYNSLSRMLSNKRYIGVYMYKGQETPGGMPRILDDDLFYKVQDILDKNKKAPARTHGEGEYLLTTKLFCGHCKNMMVGYGGTSKTGKQYHYYICKEARKKRCDKTIVGKKKIEDRVIAECLKLLTDENIRFIAQKVAEECNKSPDNLTVKQLKKAIREADIAIENLWRGIEQGQSVTMLTERLNKRQAEKDALEEQLAIEENKRVCLSEAQILAFLNFVCEMPLDDVNKRRAIINILVHSVYLYDDHFTLIINASKKPMSVEDVPLEEIEEAFNSNKTCTEQCSTMTSPAPPRILGVSLGYSLFSHGEFCVILLERKIGMYGDVGLNEVKRIDINHYFIEKGTGEPLILLHGNGENCGYFQGQIDAFSKLYHVYALDTRGHGKTPRGDKPFTIRQFADDLLGFMDEHQIEKAHLLGFSDGGNIAMIFAIQFPDRVNRLILNGANLNPKGVKRSTQIPIEIGYKIAKKFAGKSDSARLNAETLGLMVNDPNVEPEELAKIKTKTLVIAGTKDMIKEEHTRLIASSIPDSVLVFLNGDHFIASKHPEEFNQAILQFLRS